jgi:hypothetical protein
MGTNNTRYSQLIITSKCIINFPLKEGNLEAALTHFSNALEVKPNDMLALLNRSGMTTSTYCHPFHATMLLIGMFSNQSFS